MAVDGAKTTHHDRYERVRSGLINSPRVWLITGVAGFIGSNLLSELLSLGQTVTGVDNFSTGHQANLDAVLVSHPDAAKRFRLISGDVRDLEVCRVASAGVDYVLHQAALGSVPRSIRDPLTTAHVNIDGFLHTAIAARDAGVKRLVYASSSSVYGDSKELPQTERRIGRPLSPYAATKATAEMFADVFQRTYGIEMIGLRYFNVFGPHQDPEGAYAAVIPRWISKLIQGETCEIFGDGETSRDFSHVSNVVQANLLAAAGADSAATGQLYNIACGQSTSLNTLFSLIRDAVASHVSSVSDAVPRYGPFRPGDVPRSLADITNAGIQLGYDPEVQTDAGLEQTVQWYIRTAVLRPAS